MSERNKKQEKRKNSNSNIEKFLIDISDFLTFFKEVFLLLFSRSFYDYFFPLIYALISLIIFISEKKVIEINITNNSLLLIIGILLSLSSFIMHFYQTITKQKLSNKKVVTKDYYQLKNKSKKRKDNI